MDFGFDTIQKSLQTSNATKQALVGTTSNLDGNANKTQVLLQNIQVSQQSLGDRINTLQQNLDTQSNTLSNQTLILGVVAIAAIAVAAVALLTRRRSF